MCILIVAAMSFVENGKNADISAVKTGFKERNGWEEAALTFDIQYRRTTV
jgi:hypothetical protein